MKHLYFSFLLLSLQYTNLSEAIQVNAKITVEANAYILSLDSETAFSAGAISPVDSDATKLSLLNGPTSSIKVFNSDNKRTVQTIPIPKEGPGALNAPIYMTSSNNEFFVFDFYKNELCQINTDGVVNKYKTLSDEDSMLGQLSNSLAPIIVTEEKIYVSTQGQLLKDRSNYHLGKTVMIIDRDSKEITGVLDYPEIYKSNLVAGGKVSMASLTYDSKKKSVIVSFPLSNDIYEITQQNKVIKHSFEYKLEGIDEIPFSSASQLARASIKDIQKKYIVNASYSLIHYDQFTNTYWRVIALPMNNDEQINKSLSRDTRHRNYRILALNGAFEVVGESGVVKNIDVSFGSAKFFSNKEGFFIADKRQLNEDILVFSKIKLSL